MGEAYARPKNSGAPPTTGGTALATFINDWSVPVTVVRLGGGHLAAHLNCPAQVREEGSVTDFTATVSATPRLGGAASLNLCTGAICRRSCG